MRNAGAAANVIIFYLKFNEGKYFKQIKQRFFFSLFGLFALIRSSLELLRYVEITLLLEWLSEAKEKNLNEYIHTMLRVIFLYTMFRVILLRARGYSSLFLFFCLNRFDNACIHIHIAVFSSHP